MFNFNFSPLRAVVFGIFLILIWALYPAVLSNWTPNHLAELNFSSGEGCEVSQPKIKYSALLCSVEASQGDHQTHCKAGREAVMFFVFFSIWKLLCSSWIGDICWELCEQTTVQGTGLCKTSTGLTRAGAGTGNWPCQLGLLRHCPPWAGSAPPLHYLPAGLIGGGEGQWQCLLTALELRRLASALKSLSGWLEGYLLGGSVHTAGCHGKGWKWKKIYSCFWLNKAHFYSSSFTNSFKTQCHFLGVPCQNRSVELLWYSGCNTWKQSALLHT